MSVSAAFLQEFDREAATTRRVLAAFDRSVQTRDTPGTLGDSGLKDNWKGTANGATIMEMPKVALIYGPSADEGPFRG